MNFGINVSFLFLSCSRISTAGFSNEYEAVILPIDLRNLSESELNEELSKRVPWILRYFDVFLFIFKPRLIPACKIQMEVVAIYIGARTIEKALVCDIKQCDVVWYLEIPHNVNDLYQHQFKTVFRDVFGYFINTSIETGSEGEAFVPKSNNSDVVDAFVKDVKQNFSEGVDFSFLFPEILNACIFKISLFIIIQFQRIALKILIFKIDLQCCKECTHQLIYP